MGINVSFLLVILCLLEVFPLATDSHDVTHSDISKGCGRFFEGDAAQMNKALNETLASLPDDTKVYVCHLFMVFACKLCLLMLRFRAAMNTPSPMSSSSLLYQTLMRSRSFTLLRRVTSRRKAFSLSGMRRLVSIHVYNSVMIDTNCDPSYRLTMSL